MPVAEPLPEYACALITDARGWLLLQLRPADARFAANQLTCFGGRREPRETTTECLLRELDEELGWRPATLIPACELWQRQRFIARFYRSAPPVDRAALRIEARSSAVLAPWPALAGMPLSPWHRQVLDGIRMRTYRVDL